MGYTGGTLDNPTYQVLGDHTESVQMDYDSSVLSYEELLDSFFAFHNPYAESFSEQYKSAIFYATEDQKLLAEEKKAAIEEQTGNTVYTEILPLKTFYLAEDYHQKYYLRNVPLLAQELDEKYPTIEAFLNAPSATRINGYVFGCGTLEGLMEDLPSFDLSSEAEELLKGMVE